MRLRSLLAFVAMAVAGLLTTSGADAQVLQVGNLTCQVAPGVGMVVASRKELTCTFQNAAGELEIYDGAITKIGVDIGFTDGATIVWSVLAPSGRIVRGALAGSYVGVTAEATAGAGIGANALVGGFRRSITLQPLSASAQTGVGIAAGVAGLNLHLRPPPGRPYRR